MSILFPNEEVSRDQMKGYRIFIWSHDHPHPPHVHLRKGKAYSTWDLRDLTCVNRGEFSSSELRAQAKLLQELHPAVLRSWHGYWQIQGQRP